MGPGTRKSDGKKVIFAFPVKKGTGKFLKFPDPDRLNPNPPSVPFDDDETSLDDSHRLANPTRLSQCETRLAFQIAQLG